MPNEANCSRVKMVKTIIPKRVLPLIKLLKLSRDIRPAKRFNLKIPIITNGWRMLAISIGKPASANSELSNASTNMKATIRAINW